ncbi:ferritin-like domain-containing protein [Helicobacter typhlonius]|uniref:ferritin-like domain-containing protein n=1 Tax=Helicobacter typhlonius TaxID=76936 RepID=UPI002FE17640
MFFDMLFDALNATTPEQKRARLNAFATRYKDTLESVSVLESANILESSHISKHHTAHSHSSTKSAKELDSHILESSLESFAFLNDTNAPIYPIQSPSYAGFCTITHPTKIRRPKHIKSEQSLAKVLHSIVHIEYSAIDLALDAMYRFRGLPPSYYYDWLMVALEEELHFRLLRECLNGLGYEYGDFAVHSQLFDVQKATLRVDERMALLHRGLEANGLDANPFVVRKVREFEHTLTEKLLESLDIILHDEISHVKKGDKWWRYTSDSSSAQDFATLLRRFKQLGAMPRMMNIQARLQAGYTLDELKALQNILPQ